MRIFVAGATGMLGRAAVRALRTAGHEVRGTARAEAGAAMLRGLGAEAVDAGVYDRAALAEAMAGCEVAMRLTTKVPALTKMGLPGAWRATNRLREEGTRVLVDAALDAGVGVLLTESICFQYADAGDQWIDERSPVDVRGRIMEAAAAGEREAARFSTGGGKTIVLRLGAFYSAESDQTQVLVANARRHLPSLFGDGGNYYSSIHIPDAGNAVAAAVGAPAGTYNIVDDDPVRFKEYIELMCQAVGAPPPRRLPRAMAAVVLGQVAGYVFRSLRVTSAQFKEATGWSPEVPGVRQGWPLVASLLNERRL